MIVDYPFNFTILDRSDSESIIKRVKDSLHLGGSGKRFPSKRVLLSMISGSVNKCCPLELIIIKDYTQFVEHTADILAVSKGYTSFKENNHLMDYDDLLVNLRRLLSESAFALDEICSQFHYLLVDEYQDTNLIQAELVSLLGSHHKNIMAVGDDAQSIYSFRGADYENIMQFPEQYPGADVIKLEQNYRSSQAILSLTNAVISQAKTRYTKQLFSTLPTYELPLLCTVSSQQEEARMAVDNIQHLISQGIPKENIAVLFRSGFDSYNIEVELLSRNIDFHKRGGIKFTDSAHVKDMLAFFRLLLNDCDKLSWTRILLMLQKVGPKTVCKILSTVLAANTPFFSLHRYPSKAKWAGDLHALADMLISLRRSGLSLVQRFDLIMTWYEPIFQRIYPDDYLKRLHDLDYVRTLASEYFDVESFLDHTALDPPDSVDSSSDESKLVLSTIHSSKGLEWDAVFVLGLADGLFPRKDVGEDLEEERRLFYVASTRAKQVLYLMYPKLIRTYDGKITSAPLTPFLSGIDSSLYWEIQSSTVRNYLEREGSTAA